jgi:hypothetical protein
MMFLSLSSQPQNPPKKAASPHPQNTDEMFHQGIISKMKNEYVSYLVIFMYTFYTSPASVDTGYQDH